MNFTLQIHCDSPQDLHAVTGLLNSGSHLLSGSTALTALPGHNAPDRVIASAPALAAPYGHTPPAPIDVAHTPAPAAYQAPAPQAAPAQAHYAPPAYQAPAPQAAPAQAHYAPPAYQAPAPQAAPAPAQYQAPAPQYAAPAPQAAPAPAAGVDLPAIKTKLQMLLTGRGSNCTPAQVFGWIGQKQPGATSLETLHPQFYPELMHYLNSFTANA